MIRQPSAQRAWIGTRRSGSRASVGTVSSVTRIRRSFRSASDHRFSFSSRRTSTSPAIDLRGASVSLTRTAKLLCSSPPPLPRRAKDTERTRNEQPYSNQRLFERKFRAIYLAANHLVDRSSATPVRASSTLQPCIRGTPEVQARRQSRPRRRPPLRRSFETAKPKLPERGVCHTTGERTGAGVVSLKGAETLSPTPLT
jgi:hypothetical protein